MASAGLPSSATGSSDYMENGRLYHGFRRGMYMFPCDETEKERMDLFHQLFLTARRSILHHAPVQNTPETRILDLGTGTGIWAIDMADKFHEAEVVGIDLANIQPERIPPNLRFRVPRDFESIWGLGEDSWDLIHLRQGCGSVQSWPELYQKIFVHLKPGHGWIEQVEIDFEPRCDDNSLHDSAVVEWYRYLKEATERANRPIAYQCDTRRMLENAGFIDIQEQVIRAPFNSWPNDPHQKEIGQWYYLGLGDSIHTLSLAPFTRVFRWSPDDIEMLTGRVKRHVTKRKCRGYNNIHIWTARRPQS